MPINAKGNNLTEIPIVIQSATALATVYTDRFLFCDVEGALVGAGLAAAGVVNVDASIGEAISYMSDGYAIVQAGAAVGKGDAVEADAASKAITKSAGVTLGVARTVAVQAGDYILVHLACTL